MEDRGKPRHVGLNQLFEHHVGLIDTPLRPSKLMIIDFDQECGPGYWFDYFFAGELSDGNRWSFSCCCRCRE